MKTRLKGWIGMNRRSFLSAGFAAGTAVSTVSQAEQTRMALPGRRRFKLNYAPHFGMFKHNAGEDLIDQLQFMADQGFTALEDNGMMNRPVELQEQIARRMAKLGLSMGVFVANADFSGQTFIKRENRDMLVKKLEAAVEVARRVNARWSTVVPDAYDNGIEWDYQTANVIENLKWCADVCEPSGLIMVLEPLNPWANHPGLFLSKIPQAYQICRAVNSPSCKILDDLYHQQITEGNLIPNIDKSWEEIAYIQVGDNPGRNEPTTGEINYKNIFRHIHNKGYTGIVGMEHGNSKPGKEGELAVIEAYAQCDDFQAG